MIYDVASFSSDLPTKAKDSLWEADSSRPTKRICNEFWLFFFKAKEHREIKFKTEKQTMESNSGKA